MNFLREILLGVIVVVFAGNAEGLVPIRELPIFDLPKEAIRLNSVTNCEKENPVVIPVNGDILTPNCIKITVSSQCELCFPVDGYQPTPQEIEKWSCANVDNRKESSITTWYMQMFGKKLGNGKQIKCGTDINNKKIPIIFFDSSFTQDQISIFWNQFENIAASQEGRKLLYKILISIRVHRYIKAKNITYISVCSRYKTCWSDVDGLCFNVDDSHLMQAFRDYTDYTYRLNTWELQPYIWESMREQIYRVTDKEKVIIHILSHMYSELFAKNNPRITKYMVNLLTNNFADIKYTGYTLNMSYNSQNNNMFNRWSAKIVWILVITFNSLKDRVNSNTSRKILFERLVYWLGLARGGIALLSEDSSIKKNSPKFGCIFTNRNLHEIWHNKFVQEKAAKSISTRREAGYCDTECGGTIYGQGDIDHSDKKMTDLALASFSECISNFVTNREVLLFQGLKLRKENRNNVSLLKFIYECSWSSTYDRGQGAVIMWLASAFSIISEYTIDLESKERMGFNILQCPEAMALCYESFASFQEEYSLPLMPYSTRNDIPKLALQLPLTLYRSNTLYITKKGQWEEWKDGDIISSSVCLYNLFSPAEQDFFNFLKERKISIKKEIKIRKPFGECFVCSDKEWPYSYTILFNGALYPTVPGNSPFSKEMTLSELNGIIGDNSSWSCSSEEDYLKSWSD